MNLDENAVGRLLRMEEVIPAMERALAAFSSGKVVQPTRVMVPVAEHGASSVSCRPTPARPSARSWSLSTRTTQRYPPTMLPSSSSSPRQANPWSRWTGSSPRCAPRLSRQ